MKTTRHNEETRLARTTVAMALEPAWLERELRIATGTRPLRDALLQAERYRGHSVARMSASEALLVLALLERHAAALHRGELAECLTYPDPREVQDLHRALAGLSARQWLRATPLHRALTQRASQ